MSCIQKKKKTVNRITHDGIIRISSLKENTLNKWIDGDSQQRNGYLKRTE